MTIKTYKSHSDIAFTVKINGVRKFVNFVPYSWGGSILTTKDELLQDVLDKKIAGGNAMFWLESAKVDESAGIKAVKQPSMATEETKVQSCTDAENSILEVKVTDVEQARDYLVDNCGVDKRSLRTISAMLKAAEANKIKFVGI